MGCIQLGVTFRAENWNSRWILQTFFIKFFTARESNDRQFFDWMNSIQFNQIQS